MSNGQTRLDTLPALSLKRKDGVTKSARLAEAGVVTFSDLLRLSPTSFRHLNNQLTGIDLTALRKKVRSLFDNPEQETKTSNKRVKTTAHQSSASSSDDGESEHEPPPKKSKPMPLPPRREPPKKRKILKGVYTPKTPGVDALVVVKRPQEPPFPPPQWSTVAHLEACTAYSLGQMRTAVVDKQLIRIDDSIATESFVYPLLRYLSKDCARLTVAYCIESSSFRCVDFLVDFGRLQHLMYWGYPLASFDSKGIFQLFERARKVIAPKPKVNVIQRVKKQHDYSYHYFSSSDKKNQKSDYEFIYTPFEEPTTHTIGETLLTPIRALNLDSRLTCTLYNYQIASLSWMLHLENIIDQKGRWPIFPAQNKTKDEKFQIVHHKLTHQLDLHDEAYQWPGQNTSLCFDANHGRIYAPEVIQPIKLSWASAVRVKIFAGKIRARAQKNLHRGRNFSYMQTQGGVLADEMGLGKTLTCIALIACHQGKPKSVSSHIQLPTAMTFPTRASLVVCPSHLVKQWEDQISKHSTLQCICITTKPQHEKYSYSDFLRTDVVLVSTQFLEGDYYTKFELEVLKEYPNPSGSTLFAAQSKFLQLQRREVNMFDLPAPQFFHFTWHRLIVDEAHEVHDGKFKLWACVDGLEARRRWFVSGTPFASGDKSAESMFRFLRVGVTGLEEGADEKWCALEQLKSCWFYRNTKKSIGQEHCVPGVFEEVELLELGPIERGLYWWAVSERFPDTHLQQLACYPPLCEKGSDVTGAGTLVHMHVAMLAKLRALIPTCQHDLAELRKDLKKHSPDTWAFQSAEHRIKGKEEYLAKCTKCLAYFKNMGTLLGYPETLPPSAMTTSSSSSSSLADEEDEKTEKKVYVPAPLITKTHVTKGLLRTSVLVNLRQCVVCKANPKTIVMTPCGHTLCATCAEVNLELTKCPSCDTVLKRSELASVLIEQPQQSPERDAIERYGTKLGSIVNKILELVKVAQNRIIVFSQFDPLLLKFATILHENSIQNFFVRGNVHVRNKAIKEFQQASRPTVLLLSLSNAASGTDLCVATHVLLLDPVVGTKEEAKATEAQAIGRAFRQGQSNRVMVIRFVVKNTVEQEMHDRKLLPPPAEIPESDLDAYTGPRFGVLVEHDLPITADCYR